MYLVSLQEKLYNISLTHVIMNLVKKKKCSAYYVLAQVSSEVNLIQCDIYNVYCILFN